jgi:hypothetical protein
MKLNFLLTFPASMSLKGKVKDVRNMCGSVTDVKRENNNT